MSIAISATVRPSRILALMLVFMFVLANTAIGYVGFHLELNQIYIVIVIFLCVLLSLHILRKYFRKHRPIHLDISDCGDIIFRSAGSNSPNVEAMKVKLLESSTLWPQVMMLSLCSEEGKIFVLPILRDSVDAITFTRLSVALNWISMHAQSAAIQSEEIPSGNF